MRAILVSICFLRQVVVGDVVYVVFFSVRLLRPPRSTPLDSAAASDVYNRQLVALGGFDPAFHYFLDETDLNMRLARAGHATAIAPLAEVHHGFAANALRAANRVPRDLFDIGARWAVFHRKHLPEAARASHWHELRAAERARLLRHRGAGGVGPGGGDPGGGGGGGGGGRRRLSWGGMR